MPTSTVSYSEPEIMVNENKIDLQAILEEAKMLSNSIYECYKNHWIGKDFSVVIRNPPTKTITSIGDSTLEFVFNIKKMNDLGCPFTMKVEIYVAQILCKFDVMYQEKD